MRAQSLTLAAAGAALLAPTMPPTTTQPVASPPAASPPVATPSAATPSAATPSAATATADTPTAATPPTKALHGPEARTVRRPEHRTVHQREGNVLAADLLTEVRGCAPVSRGRYRSDGGEPADIPVCGKRGAVYWKADMDIDCDGRPGRHCNRRTDPLFSATTAHQQSDGRHLNAERLPYVVVPAPSRIWDHRRHGVRGGTVAAVIHRDRVQYAVVGDVGPHDLIGEASYATAAALGIRPDPRGGGTDSGVTYILFENSGASPIEDHRAAAAQGERLAREFIGRR